MPCVTTCVVVGSSSHYQLKLTCCSAVHCITAIAPICRARRWHRHGHDVTDSSRLFPAAFCLILLCYRRWIRRRREESMTCRWTRWWIAVSSVQSVHWPNNNSNNTSPLPSAPSYSNNNNVNVNTVGQHNITRTAGNGSSVKSPNDGAVSLYDLFLPASRCLLWYGIESNSFLFVTTSVITFYLSRRDWLLVFYCCPTPLSKWRRELTE